MTYDELAEKLREKNGNAAASGVLAVLEANYPDPASRFQQLRELLRSQGVVVIDGQPPRPPTVGEILAAAGSLLPSEPAAKALTVVETLAGIEAEPPASRRPRKRPGPVNAKSEQKYLQGGFFRMPNDFADELLAIMPGPVLKGYIYGHRLARIDGTFYISAGKLAARIGAKSTRHGQRVLARLQQAGLFKLIARGSARTHEANTYQLVPLETLDLDCVRETLTQPLREEAYGPGDRKAYGPRGRSATGPGDRTTQTE